MSSSNSILDSRLYAILQVITTSVRLSLLWAVASLPVITIAPATAALFGVLREEKRGDEPEVWRAFRRHFVANFRQAMIIQFLWTAIGVALIADLEIAAVAPAWVATVLGTLVTIAALVTAVSSVFLFPLMVGYQIGTGRLLHLSVLFALGRPSTTIRCLITLTVTAVATYLLPFVVLLVAAVVAGAVYTSCDRVITALGISTEPLGMSQEACA